MICESTLTGQQATGMLVSRKLVYTEEEIARLHYQNRDGRSRRHNAAAAAALCFSGVGTQSVSSSRADFLAWKGRAASLRG